MFHDATILSPESAASTSLVTTSETVEELLRFCPRVEPRWMFDLNNPTKWIRAGCDAYCCPVCGPSKARRFSQAVSWTLTQQDKSRFLTFTQAPDEWQARRQRMRDLARRIRSEGYLTEWAWTTEKGSRTGMVHVHATQWGDYIPQRALQDMWGKRVDIRAVKVTEKTVAGYMVKEAQGVGNYISKEASGRYMDWLELNGGRPLHSSRGFFMGLGLRGALSASREASRRGPAPVWVKANASDLKAWMAFKHTGEVELLDLLKNRA